MRDVLAECYRRLETAEEAVVLMYEHLVPVDHPAECYDCDARLGEVGNVWGSARRHDAAREAFGERVAAALAKSTP